MMHSPKEIGRHQDQVANHLSAFQQRTSLHRFEQWKPGAYERLNFSLREQPEQDSPVLHKYGVHRRIFASRSAICANPQAGRSGLAVKEHETSPVVLDPSARNDAS